MSQDAGPDQEKPETGIDKAICMLNNLYRVQVGICIVALEKLQSADLSDKNILIRAIMHNVQGLGIDAEPSVEDYALDYWIDRAKYVDDSSFNLYVTQAEGNVLWNIEKKGQQPGRLNVPQQQITVRGDWMGEPPFVPLAYMKILSGKLWSMAFPDDETASEFSDFTDESTLIGMMADFMQILETAVEDTEVDNKTVARMLS